MSTTKTLIAARIIATGEIMLIWQGEHGERWSQTIDLMKGNLRKHGLIR